ncbi:unnamed protein product [Amoebophrya sp. A120]|nr:unnamed protein product [Amoebophrya sp. A120]|eukprot:GSA120T00004012001.1
MNYFTDKFTLLAVSDTSVLRRYPRRALVAVDAIYCTYHLRLPPRPNNYIYITFQSVLLPMLRTLPACRVAFLQIVSSHSCRTFSYAYKTNGRRSKQATECLVRATFCSHLSDHY